MDPLFITVAFIFGFLVRQLGLPTLVGFLAAGFALNTLGFKGGESLEVFADLGVTILLFTIGLKLRLRSLARPEVWAGSSLHMITTVVVFGLGVFGLKLANVPLFTDLTLPSVGLIAFALSFSSTVFAVKILEEKAEMGAMHGRVAIGILIMQDLFAVLFLSVSLGKLPSLWAVTIPLVLFILKPILYRLMDQSGHRELLILFGLFVALAVGAAGFELVGLKADLGALIVGVLLSGHKKSSELAKTLMGVKELLLVGFFLNIGLSGFPTITAIGVSAIIVSALVFKGGLFFLLLTRFKLRARSSLLASLSLANYSEFGLIVAAVGVSQGWLHSEWLVIISLALATSFIISSPLNTAADALYIRHRSKLCRFETDTRHLDDQPIESGNATIGIFGMGRIGTKAYDFLRDKYGDTVIGFDFNTKVVADHCNAGRRVVYGDPTDPDFLQRVNHKESQPRLAVMAMSEHRANLAATKHLIGVGFSGMITSVAHFDDHVNELLDVGSHSVFNVYSEAGLGFAKHVWEIMEDGDFRKDVGKDSSCKVN